MSAAVALPVPCPRCGVEREFSPANAFRPFCSERCRMIDLGAWADERYRIAAREESPADDSTPESR